MDLDRRLYHDFWYGTGTGSIAARLADCAQGCGGSSRTSGARVKSSTVWAILMLAAVAVAGPARGIETERAYHTVGDKLICLCGCMQSVYGCNHYGCPQSDGLRKEVRAAIASTNSEDEALAVMVTKYGDRILTEPPKHGFSLTAWVMPFAVLALGG